MATCPAWRDAAWQPAWRGAARRSMVHGCRGAARHATMRNQFCRGAARRALAQNQFCRGAARHALARNQFCRGVARRGTSLSKSFFKQRSFGKDLLIRSRAAGAANPRAPGAGPLGPWEPSKRDAFYLKKRFYHEKSVILERHVPQKRIPISPMKKTLRPKP